MRIAIRIALALMALPFIGLAATFWAIVLCLA
jgi:hypothetical protein